MSNLQYSRYDNCMVLNNEQLNLLLSARKEPGNYFEGVVLADIVVALFR